jgi:aminoglycoside phosphotransferase (APT) family kinase protein
MPAAIEQEPAAEISRALAGWLAKQMGVSKVEVGAFSAPSANGFSNITTLFDATWKSEGGEQHRKLVARIESTGEGLFPTYDVGRQFDVMKALEASSVPVPEVLWMERRTAIFGAPFMVMEYIEGNIPSDDPSFAASEWILGMTPQQRRELCDNAIAALVQVHQLDWRRHGLGWLARPGDGTTAQRELAYYDDFYHWAAEGLKVPVIEAGLAWARQRIPADDEVVLSWGDSRIGNMIFGDDRSVLAVIDWEGATLASPEKDLGHWLQLTHVYTEQFGIDLPEGFYDRTALLQRYEELSGRKLANVTFYEVMSGIHSAIQAMRALSLIGRKSKEGRDEAAILNNPFTRGLARLIGFEMPAEAGLGIFTGKR